jgi:hypothetical protein
VGIAEVADIVTEYRVKRSPNLITVFFPETKIELLGTHWFLQRWKAIIDGSKVSEALNGDHL